MPEYVASALFVYTEESTSSVASLKQNPFGTTLSPVAFETLQQNPAKFLRDADHVVISGSMDFLKEMVRYAIEYDFSIGLVTLSHQKSLARALTLPEDMDGLIDLALRKDVQTIDLIQCNEKILFFKASVGRIPLIDNPIQTSRIRILSGRAEKVMDPETAAVFHFRCW